MKRSKAHLRHARRRCASCGSRHAPAPPLAPDRLAVEARGDLTRLELSLAGGTPLEQEAATVALLRLGAEATGPGAFVLEGRAAARFLIHDAAELAAHHAVRMPAGLLERSIRPAPVVAQALITAGTERLHLALRCASGEFAADPDDVAQALGEQRDIVRLADETYGRLGDPRALAPLVGYLRPVWDKGLALSYAETQRLAQALSPLGKVHVEPRSAAIFARLASAHVPSKPRGLQAELRPYQQDGLDTLRYWHDLGTGGVLADDMGLGKEQSISVPTPTPSGWRRFGDLRVGDEVFGLDGKPTRVTGVFPRGIKPVFRVRMTSGAETIAGLEHLWRVQSPVHRFRGHPGKVLTTAQLMASGLRAANGNMKWFVPMAAPVEYEEAALPLHPYVIGAYLANGCFAGRARSFCGTEDQLVELRKRLPPDMPLATHSECDHTFATPEARSRFASVVGALGLQGKLAAEKRVPPQYMTASIAQRLDLLQGLMDNDGTVSKDGMVAEYNTVSVGLADDVAELVRSLGGVALRSQREPHYVYKGERRTGQTDNRVRVSLPPDLCPFSLPRKVERFRPRTKYPPAHAIESITPIGEAECVCISVEAPDHLYVTSDYIVTHNTLQTISLLASVRQDIGRIRALIVTPTSVVSNWAAEFNKFAPFVRVHTWDGPNRLKHEAEARSAEVLLTSYGLMRRDGVFFDSLGLDYLILDEAQAIKNPYSATTQAAKKLRAAHRLAITGTPVENRLNEFWSLFDFTSPGLLGSLATFEAAIRSVQGGDNSAVARLRQLVGPFLLRRLKSEVAKDLPAKDMIDYVCPLSERQQAAYDEAIARTRAQFGGALDGRSPSFSSARMHILAAITRLRQLACDARISGAGGTWTDDDSGKLMALRELLDQCREGGHKVLIFSQFVEMLAILRRVLEKDGFVYEYIDGSTQKRQTHVDRFQNDPKVLVFLISLKAGGTGLNLTAADTVIHFDPWWNPAVEAQATDRAYRIGQKRPVTVYRMIAKGTIEQRIAALKARKAKLANNVLAEGVSGGDELSADDIRDLLS